MPPASSTNDVVRDLLQRFSYGEVVAPELLPLVRRLGWTSEPLLEMLRTCYARQGTFSTSRFEDTISGTADVSPDEAMLCFMVGEPGVYYRYAVAAGMDADVLRAEVHKELQQRQQARARSQLRKQQQAAP